MTGNPAGTTTGGRELPQLLALGFGTVYVLVGLIGFLVTGFSGFAEPNTNEHLLGIFELNPFHNVGHLITGLTGLLLARTLAGARAYDNLLHAGVILAGLVIALLPARQAQVGHHASV